MANQATGLTRIIKAAGYSYKGLSAAWQHEAAFRQELVVTLLAIILAVWLDVGAIARILLIGSVALVMIVEILNSAIEAVVDRIGSEHHELSGRAKDMDRRRCRWRSCWRCSFGVRSCGSILADESRLLTDFYLFFGSQSALTCIYSQQDCINKQGAE